MLDINKFSNKLLTQGYLGCFIPHEKSLVIIFYIPEENKPKKKCIKFFCDHSYSSVVIPNENNQKHLWLIHFTLGLL